MPRTEATTEGRDELKTWFEGRRRGTQADLARRLGVSPQLVNQWLSGTSRPGEVCREGLERVTGIEPFKWDTEEEAERRVKALAAEPLPPIEEAPESAPSPETRVAS